MCERMGKVDYRIDMNGVRKVFHVNMLKKYVDRKSEKVIQVNTSVSQPIADVPDVPWEEILPSDFAGLQETSEVRHRLDKAQVTRQHVDFGEHMSCVGVITETDTDGMTVPTIPTKSQETIEDVNISPKLDKETKTKVKAILTEFSDILTDRPGKAQGVEPHRIILTDDVPVRKRPYPLPFSVRQVIEREVQTMLDMGVIEPSTSAYSSPVVLVAKPDGTVRFCIDFRALNAKTVFDEEPIPDIDELFCQLARADHFAKLDLTN